MRVAWGDPKILEEIVRQSRRKISDPRLRRIAQRAAVQTGIVESGGRNLPGGDADSQGWRQERASLYSNPTNVKASVGRFLTEFVQQYDPGEKSFEVAAQVQRPAAQFRGRYADVRREANQLLRQARGSAASAGGSGTPDASVSLPGTAAPRNLPQGSEGLVSLLAGLQQPKPQISSAGVAPPEFSAAAALPAGYQGVSSGGGPAPKPDISGLLDAVKTLGGDISRQGSGPASVQIPGAGTGGTAGPGRARLLPGADRAGVSTKPYVVNFAKEIQAIAGGRVRIGTGTNHDRLTVNGNVSNHWTGDAGDVPASGKRLISLGQAALIAAGADPKWARKQTGGLYNVKGAQIIFNTQEGGDHTDHLHFRPPPKKK